MNGPVIYADAYAGDLKKFVESEGLTAEPDPPEGITTIQFSGFPEEDNWAAQAIAFREAIKADAPSPIPPEGVLLTNVIMDGIFRSHAAGKEVAVRVPEI